MATATAATKQQTVLEELEAQRVKLVRVKRRQTELGEERRQLGARKPASGLIGAAVERRLAALAAGVRDDQAADTKPIDAELERLEDRRDEIAGELAAHAAIIAELAELRRQTLHDPDRHEQLMVLARDKAAEGEALIATAAAAAHDVEQARGLIIEAVQLAITGASDDIDERRAAGATFSPWVVPVTRDGMTPVGNPLPAYWEAIATVASPPAAQ
jgi:hypothetical protein